MSPEQVRDVVFPDAGRLRPGLRREPVFAFRAEVEAELDRLLGERAALADEVARLRRRVLRRGEAGRAGYTSDVAHVQAVTVLSQARQTADQYVADAQEYSRQIMADAQRRGAEILAEARASAALISRRAG